MCGIAMGFSKKGKKISKSIMKRYMAQKHRGSNGFGYVAVYKDRFSVGRSTDEDGIRTQIMNENASMIMYHHRLPTSTANVIEATHPIWVSHEELDFNYFVVHNGVCRNADELRKKHEGYSVPYVYNTVIETETTTQYVSKATGKKYYTSTTKVEKFNDSEALAIEVARVLDGMSHKIEAVGTIAFVAYKFEKETNKLMSISYGHNTGNPLTYTDNNDYFMLASEGGESLPINVLFTLSTSGDDFGQTTGREFDIGYMTEWQKNNNTNDKNESKKDDKTDPSTPFPRQITPVGQDVKTYRKNEKGTFESADDYYDQKYGFSNQRKLNWGEKDNNVRTNVGFDLEQGRVDTTTKDFEVESSKYIRQYLLLREKMNKLEEDINFAEYLLQDKDIDKISKWQLEKELSSYQQNMETIQGSLNQIEDEYYEDLGESIPFHKLIEAYEEQEDIQFDSIEDVDERKYASPYVR